MTFNQSSIPAVQIAIMYLLITSVYYYKLFKARRDHTVGDLLGIRSPRQELVAGMAQSPSPCGLALLACLLLAGLVIVELADISQQLLAATLLLLWLLLLLALLRPAPVSR